MHGWNLMHRYISWFIKTLLKINFDFYFYFVKPLLLVFIFTENFFLIRTQIIFFMLCKLDTVIVDTRLSQNPPHPWKKSKFYSLLGAHVHWNNHGQFLIKMSARYDMSIFREWSKKKIEVVNNYDQLLSTVSPPPKKHHISLLPDSPIFL